MVDPEAIVQHLLEAAPDSVAVVAGTDEHVHGESRETGRDLPDMQVVNVDYAGIAGECRPIARASTPRGEASSRTSTESRKHRPSADEDQITEASICRRRTAGKPDGDERQTEREHIGQVVARVRDEREAAAREADDRLDRRVDTVQDERDRKRASAAVARRSRERDRSVCGRARARGSRAEANNASTPVRMIA
jgi:hypothetical protein